MASCEVFGQSLIKLIEDNNHSKPADFSAKCDKSCQTGAIEEQNFWIWVFVQLQYPHLPSFHFETQADKLKKQTVQTS